MHFHRKRLPALPPSHGEKLSIFYATVHVCCVQSYSWAQAVPKGFSDQLLVSEGGVLFLLLFHQDIADGSLNMLMNLYRELLPSLGGYLTSKTHIHRARLELFLQEAARREPLYFEQRAAEEQESAYAGKGYRDHYYEVRW